MGLCGRRSTVRWQYKVNGPIKARCSVVALLERRRPVAQCGISKPLVSEKFSEHAAGKNATSKCDPGSDCHFFGMEPES